MSDIGQELFNVPFPALIKNMGLAIAEAQMALDMSSMRLAQFMAGYEEVWDEAQQKGVLQSRKVSFGGTNYSLLELGFTPTFYQFVDTIIEIKISISISSETSTEQSSSSSTASAKLGLFWGGRGASVRVSSVNASYASKYQYHAEGSSLLRTKLVPVPVPAVFEERIRQMVAAAKAVET